MSVLLFALLGGFLALSVRYYLSNFAQWTSQEIYQTYREIFALDIPKRMPKSSILTPIKCGNFFSFFCYFSMLSIGCYGLFGFSYQAIFIACYISLLVCISLIDWHYQLISLSLCQIVFVLGVSAAWAKISSVTLVESLQSAFCGFIVFYLIYWLAKWIYGKEALGRGDYWLMLGLSSFLHWSYLPLLVLIACCCAMSYALYVRYRKQIRNPIPFAPFLCLADVLMILLNWQTGSMMNLF